MVSRRRFLSIAGGAGLGALGGGCAIPPTPTLRLTATGVASGVMLCRSAWGARPARAGGRPHTIDQMTLHHSAVALPDNRQIIARLQQHQRYHQDDKGWVDIAYHVAVDRRGNIFQLRDRRAGRGHPGRQVAVGPAAFSSGSEPVRQSAPGTGAPSHG